MAAVLAGGLLRAGATRLFGQAAVLAGAPGLDVVAAADGDACVMAAVTAELTEAPGAAALALDPGVRAAVDGLAHAARDRAPVIVLTPRHPDAGLLAPVVKASLVVTPASAAHWIAHAAQLAMADPRGPVHLQIDAADAEVAAVPVAAAARRAPLPPPDAAALDAVGEAIGRAARPLLVAGLQCTPDDARWLRAFAEALPAPVVVTPKARGALPDPHPLALGLLAADSAVLRRADLLVAIGVDAAEVAPGVLPAATPVVHVGRCPSTGPYRPVAEATGDIALVIEELAPRLRARDRADWDVAELDRMKRATAVVPAALASVLAPHRAVMIARELTDAGTIAATDLPLAAYWQAVAPRELLIPNGLATFGYALPAAIAAQLAHPQRRVVAFAGAPGLLAGAGALATAVARALPIVVVACNDTRPAHDVAAFARAAGAAVHAADSEESFRKAFYEALTARRPAVVDARLTR
ncbi:MAG: thiamine pyrophosphate-dependent enzyme [Candidatus Rokuibacteriota bacterium]